MPGETLRPDTEDQVRDVVGWAISDDVPLEIVGGGSKRAYGRPVEAANTMNLSGLHGISLYEPEELVMSAGPGTPLAEVEAALASSSQMLAFEPPDMGPLLGGDADRGTLGGVVACNLSGPRRIKAGAARDHLLGLRGVSGRGDLFKTGGRVVKNVTGYDLCKLMTGSFGTLSALTQLTVKVLPAPEVTKTVVLEGLDDAQGLAAMTAAINSPHDVSGAAHIPEALAAKLDPAQSAAITMLRVEGFGPSVDHRTAALAEAAGGGATIVDRDISLPLWRSVRDARPFCGDRRPVWRLSVAPQNGPGVVAEIGRSLPVQAFYDWAGGLVWMAVDEPPGDVGASVVRGAVDRVGGHATLVRAGDADRSAVPVFHPQSDGVAALSARIKEGFDPGHILNPGRMVAGV